ncbi:unnamed protein product [Linum tenue]|uniref:Uncharacterized protein n=1 Tax=Linum tenue TaxID=586396 RepID=A0AAV0KM70_9ROSI|nr:unnamed protein product [Linum tenue]
MREKHPDFVERLEKEGMVSRRVMGEEDDPSSAIGRGWKSTFSTNDKLVAEQRFVLAFSRLPISFHRFPFTTQTKIISITTEACLGLNKT